MSQLLVAGGLGQAFRSSTHTAAALKLFTRQQDEERLRRERKDELKDDAADLMDVAMLTISASEIEEFRFELDTYDTAAIEALHANEAALALSRERLDLILSKAYVLPDGRRVFKTEDGTQVFDEHGIELDEDFIAPDAIADSYSRWEGYLAEKTHFDALERERIELIDYQTKLDEARERLDAGDMNRQEFDELRDDLKADMPRSIRAHVPGMEAEQTPQASAAPLAEDLDITDDMLPTTFASKITAPTLGG